MRQKQRLLKAVFSLFSFGIFPALKTKSFSCYLPAMRLIFCRKSIDNHSGI